MSGQSITEIPEDCENLAVDFLLHLIRESAQIKEIHFNAKKVLIDYLGDRISAVKFKI